MRATKVDEVRAARIREVGFCYEGTPKQRVVQCNLCRGELLAQVCNRDRYGYPIGSSMCLRCGLVFLNPRMTHAAYGEFYNSVYRPLVSAYHGRLIDSVTIQAEQRDYAEELVSVLVPHLEGRSLETLFDVGGSTGVVAHRVGKEFNLRSTVLDPAPAESACAAGLGMEVVAGFLEDYEPKGRTFDLVLLCQTVDHLLDIRGCLAKLRMLVSERGFLFVDIVDFRAAYLRNRGIGGALKVDHPYYLTEETMEMYLGISGFKVVAMSYASDGLHVGYVCRPCADRQTEPWKSADPKQSLREIRHVQNAP